MTAPIPTNEARRLASLENYRILDTLPETYYDDVTRLASLLCGSPIALVSLVDGERQWFKSRVGLDAASTSRDDAFCAHAVCEPEQVMVVGDATRDARFERNPLVLGEPHIRFYAGAPLVTTEGDAVGTLCVIDRAPRELTAAQTEGLRTLARTVIAQLELRRNLSAMEQILLEQEQDLASLEDRKRRIEESHVRLQLTANTDALTALLNRRGLEHRLDEEFALATRYLAPLSILVVDVDRFKQYNDSFGHRSGDDALCRLAALLREATREFDVVARYGGEEFVVVLPNTGAPGAVVLAERVRRMVQQAAWPQRQVTVSIGAATQQPGMSTPTALFEAADAALYAAKGAGRNRCLHAGSLPGTRCAATA